METILSRLSIQQRILKGIPADLRYTHSTQSYLVYLCDQTQQHRQLEVEIGSCWRNVTCIYKHTSTHRQSYQTCGP